MPGIQEAWSGSLWLQVGEGSGRTSLLEVLIRPELVLQIMVLSLVLGRLLEVFPVPDQAVDYQNPYYQHDCTPERNGGDEEEPAPGT
jgi:hypothetical protein